MQTRNSRRLRDKIKAPAVLGVKITHLVQWRKCRRHFRLSPSSGRVRRVEPGRRRSAAAAAAPAPAGWTVSFGDAWYHLRCRAHNNTAVATSGGYKARGFARRPPLTRWLLLAQHAIAKNDEARTARGWTPLLMAQTQTRGRACLSDNGLALSKPGCARCFLSTELCTFSRAAP